MGGTWDATNLVASDVAVITPIGLDHRELGSTLTEVAGEKAGHHQGRQDRGRAGAGGRSARRARGARASEVGAAMLREFRDWEVEDRLHGGRRPGRSRCGGCTAPTRTLFLPMFGEYAVHGTRPRRSSRRSALVDGPSTTTRCARRSPACAGPAAWRSSVAQAHDRARRRAQPGGRRGARRRAAGVLPLGAAPPRGLDQRRTRTWRASSGRSPRSPTWSTRRATRANARATRSPIAEAFERRGHARSSIHASVAEAIEAARADRRGPTTSSCVTGSLYTVADARRALGTPS